MKKYEDLCATLEGEEIELNIKIEHLEHFMMSEDFQQFSERQKKLLTRQLVAMRIYKGALIARVMQARFEHEQKKYEDNKIQFKEGIEKAEKEERLEPHVFEAMAYEAHRQKKDSQKHKCETCKHNNGPHTCNKRGKDIAAAPGDLSCWESK